MNRREFLQCGALLVAGVNALPSSWAMNSEQKRFLATQPDYVDSKSLTLFSSPERAAITAIADQIIPLTDTPGALVAGAPRFIELMVADWFNEGERQLFVSGLAQLQGRAGGDFSSLGADEQLQLLEQLEQEAGDAPWYELGNVTRIWDDSAPFICQIKELTVLGFMLSEVGSKEFLQENPMGAFQGSQVLSVEQPAYAAEMPARLMTRS